MKTIYLGGEIFNCEFVKSIVPNCQYETNYPQAIIWLEGDERATIRTLSYEKFSNSSEATAKAKELIEQAIAKSNS